MINDDIKENRGGTRKGAGRPKKTTPKMESVVKRIPLHRLDDVNALLSNTIPFPKTTKPVPAPVFQKAASDPVPFARPLYNSRVAAGFPSPADDYIEDELDLNRHFVHDAEATFHVKAEGDSMNLVGIFENTILTVCKCCEPRNNDLVVVYIDGGFTVKRYRKQGQKIQLIPESTNPIHKIRTINASDDNNSVIWGLVIGTHNKYR